MKLGFIGVGKMGSALLQGALEAKLCQAADVTIRTRGGGATIGKQEVIGGRGIFSGVRDIAEIVAASLVEG